MSAMFQRQNDNTALMYLKAYKFCSKKKKNITYFMIFISLSVTLASIAVKAFGLSKNYSTAVILISGMVLVVNIFCTFLENQYNVEAVNMLERYDVYVFNLPPNKSILRPIAEQSVVNYARKYKNIKKIRSLKNYYFKSPAETEVKNMRFMKFKNDFAYEHRLLINVHVFFMILWIGYVAFIVSVAILLGFIVKDSLFIDTVTNIFVPALSTISLIASAWKNYTEQFRRLNNAVGVTGEMFEASAKAGSGISLESPLLLRQLQDTMFIHRQKSITIPEFLIKRFNKRLLREEELLHREMFITSTNNALMPAKKTSSRQRVKKPESNSANKKNVANGSSGARASSTRKTSSKPAPKKPSPPDKR